MGQIFMTAVCETSDDAIDAIDKIVSLRAGNYAIIGSMGRSAKTLTSILGYLEENPIIEIRRTAEALKMSYNTVSDAVNRLCTAGILAQVSGIRRNRVFAYEAYLEILRRGT